MSPSTHKLIYVLHSGNLYGTEQMALRTLSGLQGHAQMILLAPNGPVHEAARAQGYTTRVFTGTLSLAQTLAREIAAARRAKQALICIDTGIKQALLCSALAKLMQLPLTHLHVVHGGTDERLSYGRKSLLPKLGVQLVAVSEFVKSRLIAHGTAPEAITVIPNFQAPLGLPMRADYLQKSSIERVAVVSRLDPIKRVNLILKALEEFPQLRGLQFDLYGAGQEEQALRERAQPFANVHIHGFVPDASHRIARADLLLHTCPTEPFGLAILEAFEAGVLVMVPNRGGTAELVENRVNGLHFPANDSRKLAQALLAVQSMNPYQLQSMTNKARESLALQFSPSRGQAQYLKLLGGPCAQ